jgi:hypothetical protein
VLGEAGPAVDLDQQLGQVDLGQPGLDQLPQAPLLRGVCAVDDEVTVGELSLGVCVLFARESLKQLALFLAERTEAPDRRRVADRPSR